MLIGKAVNLRVRPVRSVDLCYPVDGLIARQEATLLGSPAPGINIESLYLVLLQTEQGDDVHLVRMEVLAQVGVRDAHAGAGARLTVVADIAQE